VGTNGGRLRTHAPEVSWAFADQCIASGTNFAMAIVAARLLAPGGYGTFMLVIAAWFTLLTIVRAGLTQPFVVEAAGLRGSEFRAHAAMAAGAIALVALAAAAVLVVVGIAVGAGGSTGQAFIVLGLFAPALLVQDFWRFAAFASRRPAMACFNDSVWGIVELVAFAAVFAAGTSSPPVAVAAWGSGGLAAGLFGCIQFRVQPSLRMPAVAWARRTAKWGGWFAFSGGVYAAGNQAVAVLVSAFAGTAALGGLRGIQTMVAPAQLVAAGGDAIALPASARRLTSAGDRALRAFAVRYGLALTVALGVYAAIFLVFHDQLIEWVLGAQFTAYGDLALPIGLGLLTTAWSYSAAVALRASRAGRALARAEIAAAIVQVALVGGLAHRYGVEGAAWGAFAASLFYAGAVWLSYVTRPSTSAFAAKPAIGGVSTE
jgi:O-antigen/teichoic acid export membrane protein